jgi:Domain of unknown function (DUF4406)
MPLVYVAGSFRAADAWSVARNVARAELAMWHLICTYGVAVLCPHTMSQNFDGTMTHEYWINATLEMMRRCDAVYVLRDYGASVGTLGEIKEARKLGIPVFYQGLRCGKGTEEQLCDWVARKMTGTEPSWARTIEGAK